MDVRCEPFLWSFDRGSTDTAPGTQTYSVGVFQWLPTTTGGLKRSKSIRVKGHADDKNSVHAKAQSLCSELNDKRIRADDLPDWVQKQYTVPRPSSTEASTSTVLRKTPTTRDRATEMVRVHIAPHLTAIGFKRRGRKFWRNLGHVCQIIEFVMDRSGTATESSVYVHPAVYWYEVETLVRNAPPQNDPPLEHHCTFRTGLYRLTPGGLGQQYDIDLTTDLAALGKQLLTDLTSYGLPWLDFRSNESNALELRPSPEPVPRPDDWMRTDNLLARPRLVFLVRAGRLSEANDALRSFKTNGYSGPEERGLAQRLGLSFPD